MIKTSLVVGATSTIGGHVLNQLLEVDGLQPVAGVRNAAKAEPFKERGIQTVEIDLSDVASVRKAVQGMDQVFLLTGYTVDMLNQSKLVVDQAEAAGAKHIVHMGAWAPDDTDLPHFGWHQFVERYIQGSRMTWTHVSPGMFMQNLLGSGSLWSAFSEGKKKGSRALQAFTANGRLGWIAAEDIARVCVAALSEPEKHAGKKYNLSTVAMSVPEIAEVVSEALGVPFHAEIHDPELFYKALLEGGMEPNYAACALETLRRFGRSAIPGQEETFPFEEIVGSPALSWADFAKLHRAEFMEKPY